MKKLLFILFLIIVSTVSYGQAKFPYGITVSGPVRIGGILLTSTTTELNKLHGVTTTTAQLNYSNTLTSSAQTQLNSKQATLVSGVNIKTVGGIPILGSGDIPLPVGGGTGDGTVLSVGVTTANGVSGSTANPTTDPRITISLGDITPTSIVASGNITGLNLSGTNTGNNAVNTLYSGLVSNATHTGDATGSTALTVVRINGTSLASLATGLLKNTTTTGIPSIASAGVDYVIPSGSVATLTTPRLIYGNSFNGSAALTQVIASTYGGTGNGFTKFTGPASSEKTFTLPNVSTTIITTNMTGALASGVLKSTTSTGVLSIAEELDINDVLNTQLSGALTDNSPTDSEIDAVTGKTPATAGAGYHKTIKDTTGTALLYMIESDGTNWFYTVMTKAV